MEQITFSISGLMKIFLFAAIAFLAAMLMTPFLTSFLYKNKLGKKIRQTGYDEKSKTPIFYSLHKSKENTPTMAGILIWLTVALITLLFNLDRAGTYLPLFTLVFAGIIGAIDDLLNIKQIGPNNGGFRFRSKLILYLMVAALGAWWFYFKLDWSSIHIPGGNYLGLPYNIELGWWYIPVFIIVLIGSAFASNETDGLDGLLGGIMTICFGAYSIIALVQGQASLAIFCGTISGALLAFLWFNIYPARFFMGDTGSMALGMTLAVVAFLTNSVVVLPVIAFVLVLEAFSVVIQIFSRKFFHKKVFLSAPIHHHFQALAWPETKVTMRFWVISAVCAALGLAIALIGRG
ncbi:MAG: phospho-N-acetylmuramoyl-pentapeptide-transferase [Patescibacteria group bacterium]|nr:phospho-N-acetylmuramoyl-pentapeptide-transferase [Patescibacteria group bacterium]